MAAKPNMFISMCCRHYTFKLLRYSRFLLLPSLRQMSLKTRTPKAVEDLRKLPRYTQIARYYVKAKERKGPSLKNWVIFGAACVAGTVGVITFIGEFLN